jgi:ubiquinone biosynthesis protein
MERIRGYPLPGPGRGRCPGINRQDLARELRESLLRQMVIDGTFHSDPASGQCNAARKRTVDLARLRIGGADGRRDALGADPVILTFQRGDPVAATDALLQLVEPPAKLDEWRLERAVGQFMIRHLAPGVPPDAQMVPDLFRLLSDYGYRRYPRWRPRSGRLPRWTVR